MSYAKINDGVIEFAPKNKDGIMNYNLALELLEKDGYKLLLKLLSRKMQDYIK